MYDAFEWLAEDWTHLWGFVAVLILIIVLSQVLGHWWPRWTVGRCPKCGTYLKESNLSCLDEPMFSCPKCSYAQTRLRNGTLIGEFYEEDGKTCHWYKKG